jgi:superfamily II DNA helicase RecQ
VLKGHIKVLYVSPERLCTPAFRRLITLLKQQQQFHTQQGRSEQPVVSLLCVDEAHCLSQWSYNFRPAFLRIRREIQFIQPAAVLALTATATPRIQVNSCANCTALSDVVSTSWTSLSARCVLLFHSYSCHISGHLYSNGFCTV